MIILPENIKEAWEKREGPIVLATVNQEGQPNAIYASCVSRFDDSTILIADNFLNKTRANILANCAGSLLFITKEGKSYQLKGTFTYHKFGELYENMKKWNPSELAGNAAVAFNISEAYTGADKLV